MNLFTVAFAGSTVTLNCDTADALEFLSLLFSDVTHQTGEDRHRRQRSLLYHKGQNEYQLMGCHVNARTLVYHVFKEIIDIARATPAYRLHHDRLEDADELFFRLAHG